MVQDAQDPDEMFPPSPQRVARRAAVLSCLSCRGILEGESANAAALDMAARLLPWRENVGAAEELEAKESLHLGTPLGQLARRDEKNLTWLCEPNAILAWALQRFDKPALFEQCDGADVANSIGFLGSLSDTRLLNPSLRTATEIEDLLDVYLTAHWRIRDYGLRPRVMDFSEFVLGCEWANMRLDGMELIDGDLAIDGLRIDCVPAGRLSEVNSIVSERHRALNWLIGWETLYSEVTTDT